MQHLASRMICVLAITLCLIVPHAGFAQNMGDALRFDPFPSGINAQNVKRAWATIPRYKEHFELLGTWPDHMMATTDLNGDGKDEILARMSSSIEGYCDAKGITCLLHIYGIRDGLLVELGRLMAGGQVIPLPSEQNGYRDILVKNGEDAFDLYRFDGTTYQSTKGQ